MLDFSKCLEVKGKKIKLVKGKFTPYITHNLKYNPLMVNSIHRATIPLSKECSQWLTPRDGKDLWDKYGKYLTYKEEW